MSDMDEESTPCAMRYGMFVKVLAFATGVLQCIVGVTQLFEAFGSEMSSFCDGLPAPLTIGGVEVLVGLNKGTVSCIGPQIRWVNSDGPYDFTSDVNGMPYAGSRTMWRGVFSFKPDVFVDLWTPMVFGVISVFLHMGQTRSDKIADNWIRFSLWFLFQACWGSFGYAGNLGILTGFIGIATSTFALMATCIAPNEKRTLDLHGVLGMLHVDRDAEK